MRCSADRDYRVSSEELDIVFLVPTARIDDDLVDFLFAGQDRRQENPVIVDVRFGSENGDLVAVWRAFQQFFNSPHASHPVADHYEPFFGRAVNIHYDRFLAVKKLAAHAADRGCAGGHAVSDNDESSLMWSPSPQNLVRGCDPSRRRRAPCEEWRHASTGGFQRRRGTAA